MTWQLWTVLIVAHHVFPTEEHCGQCHKYWREAAVWYIQHSDPKFYGYDEWNIVRRFRVEAELQRDAWWMLWWFRYRLAYNDLEDLHRATMYDWPRYKRATWQLRTFTKEVRP